MDDEIAHARIVDRRLRLGPSRRRRRCGSWGRCRRYRARRDRQSGRCSRSASSPPKTRWRSCLPRPRFFIVASMLAYRPPLRLARHASASTARHVAGEAPGSPRPARDGVISAPVIARFRGRRGRPTRPPASCTKRSAAARSQSWAFGRRWRRRSRRSRPARSGRRARGRSAHPLRARPPPRRACGHSAAGRRSARRRARSRLRHAERPPVARRRPPPATARNMSSSAGATARPTTGRPASTTASETVHSGRPRGRRGCRRSGSTTKTRCATEAVGVVGGLLRQPAIVGARRRAGSRARSWSTAIVGLADDRGRPPSPSSAGSAGRS